ncbi:MAG: hypothetical protein IT355_09520 [Gemmatimonadaceae bacterium]|nr:hypothetical protein [Gemmatimonadaceae bacterium]
MIASRTIADDGVTWAVLPSGFLTQYVGDEFGLVFTRADGGAVRFTRYSPGGIRSREASFERLSDAALLRLFRASQASLRSPEGGYCP